MWAIARFFSVLVMESNLILINHSDLSHVLLATLLHVSPGLYIRCTNREICSRCRVCEPYFGSFRSVIWAELFSCLVGQKFEVGVVNADMCCSGRDLWGLLHDVLRDMNMSRQERTLSFLSPPTEKQTNFSVLVEYGRAFSVLCCHTETCNLSWCTMSSLGKDQWGWGIKYNSNRTHYSHFMQQQSHNQHNQVCKPVWQSNSQRCFRLFYCKMDAQNKSLNI